MVQMPAHDHPRLAIIVEGPSDELFIQALAKKILEGLPAGRDVQLTTLPIHGSPRTRDMFPEIHFLLQKGYDRVIVVFDTDSTDDTEISSFVNSIQARLVQEDLTAAVRLVPVSPTLEAWLVADQDVAPHLTPGGATMASLLKRGHLKEMVARLHPEHIRERVTSFRIFEDSLREVASDQAHQAA